MTTDTPSLEKRIEAATNRYVATHRYTEPKIVVLGRTEYRELEMYAAEQRENPSIFSLPCYEREMIRVFRTAAGDIRILYDLDRKTYLEIFG